jgi:PAS domain S-box-containing protein
MRRTGLLPSRLERLTALLPDFPLAVKGVVAISLPVLALLAAMAVFYQSQDHMRRAQQWVSHTYQVRGEIHLALMAMMDAEAGTRGYVLTGRTFFLDQYFAARDDLSDRLKELETLTSDNPSQQRHLAAVQNAAADFLKALDLLREEAAAEGPRASTAEMEGAAMDRLRREVRAMQAEEDQLLASRRVLADRAEHRLEAAIFLGGGIGLLGGIIGMILLTGGIVRRVRRVEEQARRVAKGLPIDSGEVAGSDEIAGLERTLRDTARLLAGQAEELRAAQTLLERRVEQRTAELTAANEQLRQANEVRQAVVQFSPLAIWALDLEGLVTFWNPAAERIFGWSAEEVIGHPLPVIPEDQRDEFREWLGSFRRAEKLVAVERPRRRKDGTLITVSIWTAPLKDAGGNIRGTIAIDSDVTEQKLLEEQFRQSQKLEAVGRLAGGVAHDFNNLLTVVLGFAEMLSAEAAGSPQLQEYAREIEYAATRASALTMQLLAFSRRQVSQPGVLDLNEVVAHSMKLLDRVIGEDIVIQTHMDPNLGLIKADPIHIDQVIMNVVLNARDAMPHGGKLTIETAAVLLDEHYAGRHIGVVPGPYSMLAISDAGVGMDAATKNRLFEPFFTTKEVGKGTGLGLSIVYGIVKQSGGEILVYSEPGHGTTFKIYFPVAETPAETSGADAHGAHSGGTETVLVCEDESVIRKLVQTMLTRQGYRVIEAETPEQAKAIVARGEDNIDLLLTDVVMPGSSGFELAKQLQQIRPGLKVLYMSGYTDHRLMSTFETETGIPFLQKPFSAASLGQRVREALG